MCLAVFLSGHDSTLPLCLLASALHEAGHLAFIEKFTGAPQVLNLRVGEVGIDTNLEGLNFCQELFIILSGPLVNLLLSALCGAISSFYYQKLIFDFSVCNICLCAFNLLPIMSLDGGQLLYLLLTVKYTERICRRIINILTLIFLVPLATLGFIFLFKSKYNYSLLFISIYFIVLIISKEMR
ncbi:MAG: site-2 protease family protein [Ruminococcus sp.]